MVPGSGVVTRPHSLNRSQNHAKRRTERNPDRKVFGCRPDRDAHAGTDRDPERATESVLDNAPASGGLLLTKLEATILVILEVRSPGDFPRVSIRIREVPRVTAPVAINRRRQDQGAN